MHLVRPATGGLKEYVPGRSIEEVKKAYGLKSVVKLGSNENPRGASPKAMKAVREATHSLHLYPDGASRDLRAAIANLHGVGFDQVIMGNGSDEVMLLCGLAFLNPEDLTLVSENTFSEYEYTSRLMGSRVRKIPLRDHRYDLKAFAQAAQEENPKMIFLCNPNNPTGNHFSHRELLTLLKSVPKDTLVLLDEAYADFSESEDFPRSVELLMKFPNLIICRTFSKLYGFAALRLGYGIAHPEIIRQCLRVKMPFPVNRLAQAGGLAALSDGAFVRRSLAVNRSGKTQLYRGLVKLGMKPLPTEANFICFYAGRSAIALAESMAKRGVIVRALKSFGMDDWVRVTVGTQEQNLAFLGALTECLKETIPN
jgi:histidinol-phosphate aminotransferase